MGDGCYDVSSASGPESFISAGRQPPCQPSLSGGGVPQGQKTALSKESHLFPGRPVLVTDQCKGIEAHALVPTQPAPEAHPAPELPMGWLSSSVRTTSQLKSPSAQSPLSPFLPLVPSPKHPLLFHKGVLPSSI